MSKLSYYLELLDLNYDELVVYLLGKYGSASEDFYLESSYNDFISGVVRSIVKGDVSRLKEGLYCHHVDENRIQKLTDLMLIKLGEIPFECQKKDRLVYCDLIEHALLHTLIITESRAKYGRRSLVGYLLPNISEWYAMSIKPIYGDMTCYECAYLNSEDAMVLISRIEEYL